MRKLFTLLTLLAVFGGLNTFAASPSDPGISSLKAKTFTQTELLWTTPTNAATWYGEGWVVSGKSGGRSTFVSVTNKKYTINPETDETVEATACEGLGIKSNSDTKTVYFCVTNVTAVDIYVISNGGSDRTARMVLSNSSNSDKITKTGTALANSSAKITATDLDPTYTYLVKVDDKDGADMTLYAVRFTVPSADAPTITADPKSLTLNVTESGTAVNGSFTITGSNLTDGTYSLTVPSVAGLSVSPTSFTVADGEVNQSVTVSYVATENVKANSAEITATVDDVNMKVTVNYSAKVVDWTLQPVSAAASWDWSKITVNTESERYADNGIKLEGTTDPANDDDVVYENYNGGDMTIASGFDGTTMAFKGQYPIRNNNMCQNGTLHFKTTVPGNITVKFSDTGSGVSATATPRYLIVNGVQTQYWTSRPTSGTTKSNDTKTTGDIYVPAGDVTITGSQPICIYIVTFTPVDELPTVDVTVGELGYRTFTSKNPLDFTTPVEGLTAYTASVEGDNVSFTEVAGPVPAGTGLLLKANQGTYTISVPAENPEAVDNAFVGVTVETVVNGAGIYILYNGDQGLGFYKTTAESFTVGANTAYLPASIGVVVGNARSFIALHNETTGIQTAETVQPASADCYNLNGQRIAQPAKGLYIRNGQKYLVK